MYRLPSGPRACPRGSSSSARAAGPPSPLQPPAIVVIVGSAIRQPCSYRQQSHNSVLKRLRTPRSSGHDGFRDDKVLVAALVVALSDSNPWVRRDAAREVFAAPDWWDIREAVPALRLLLADPDEPVRLAAAIALSRVGDQAATAPLVELA